MSMRMILRPWDRQPPGHVPLRQRYRNGLLWSWSATREIDDVTGLAPTYAQPRGGIYYANAIGARGNLVRGSNASVGTNVAYAPNYGTPVSGVLYCAPTSVSTSGRTALGNNMFALHFGTGSAARIRLLTRMAGDAALVARVTDSEDYTTGLTVVSFSATPNGQCVLWVDGRLRGTAALAGDWNNHSSITQALYSWCGLYGQALWLRELSESEHRAIAANYWGELYEPREIWVPRSAAPGYTHPTLSNARMIWTGPGAGKPAIDYSW